jgi:hypothetical protein
VHWTERADEFLNKHIRTIGLVLVVCGLALRLYYASQYYLNPDESLHYTVAIHPWHGIVGFYRNATRILHPPLLILLMQPILLLGHSEILLRLIPSICGALFPWLVMLWMRRIAGDGAALCAQLLLTFSPALIDLSAQIRAYTLAFLFFSLGLVLLEKSLESGSRLSMIWFHVCLYLAILSEYSVAWFVASAGIYAILRLRKRASSRSLILVWATGQVLALTLYLFLYFTHIARYSHSGLEGMYTTWLQPGFPEPHESLFRFALRDTLSQFGYFFQIKLLAWAAAALFLFGVYRLWRFKSPSHAVLMLIPFCFACLGAICHLFPYGASRHTAVLDIAIAGSVGVALAYFAKDRALLILMASLPAVVIWIALSVHSRQVTDYSMIIPARHELRDMLKATAYLQNNVPSDALILTDNATDLMLGYYLGCPAFGYWESGDRYHDCKDLHFVVYRSFQFLDLADLRKGLVELHAKYGPERTVWIAAGGFGAALSLANSVSDSRSFGKTIAVFKESDLDAQPLAVNSKPLLLNGK